MSDSLKDSEMTVVTGLGTWTHTTTQASLYSMAIRCSEIPPSGLSIVINHNGSPIATSAAPAASQQVINLEAKNIFCAMGDTISAVLSSGVLIDTQPNTLKASITVGRGSNL